MTSNDKKYIVEIDGLRAIAVLSVAIFHFNNSFMKFGYLGVDIFFVISGFVITKSIFKSEIDFFSISNFYKRRLKRILPVLFVVVSVSLLLSCLLLPEGPSLSIGISSFFGFSNILLYIHGQNYFDLPSELDFLTQTWSLSVEEQFYLFFPILLIVIHKNNLSNIIIFSFLFLVSIISEYLFFHIYPSMVFYLMPFRLWELTAGALVYFFASKTNLVVNDKINKTIRYMLLLIIIYIIPRLNKRIFNKDCLRC